MPRPERGRCATVRATAALTLDPDFDLVRRAAELLADPRSRGGFEDLAVRAGGRPRDLGRSAQVWRLGGSDAVEVCEQSWLSPLEVLDEERASVRNMGTARLWRNRVTVGAAGGAVAFELCQQLEPLLSRRATIGNW